MTDMPPGRYRIVERKGRIVVTDTWAESGRPELPAAPVPGSRMRPSLTRPERREAGLLWLRRRLVALLCLGARDDAGRPILTTAYYLDEKGPRSIVLHEAGASRLGNGLLGVLAGLAMLLIVFGFSPVTAFVLLGAVGLAFTSANTTARPMLTKWFDRLGDAAK